MVNFFLGFLSVAAVLAACYALALLLTWLKGRSIKQPPIQPPAPQESTSHVYYIAAPKKKRKKRKPISVGLKGALIKDGTVVMTDAAAISSVLKSSPAADKSSAAKQTGRAALPAAKAARKTPAKTRARGKISAANEVAIARAPAKTRTRVSKKPQSSTRSPSPHRRSR